MAVDKDETLTQQIQSYWAVQPPHKAIDELEPYSKAWYQSISKHRFEVVPHHYDFAEFASASGLKVLEIGCGAGSDLAEFARNGAQVTGIDITDTAIQLTQQRLMVEELAGHAQKYDGHSLPFEDDSFDLVFSCGVLHHTPYMDHLLTEAHRVLRTGGRLKMMLYHLHSLIYYYSILYQRGVREDGHALDREALLSKYSEFRIGCPYTRCFTESQIKQTLWYFDRVESRVDYPVYDLPDRRKIRADHTLDVEATGIVDIDLFLQKYNQTIADGGDVRSFGWHLLVDAWK